MYKIAILGCENSHANSFLSLISQGLYPDIEVVGVWSDDEEASNKLCEKYGVKIMSDYSELQGQLDGVMITARHGDNHFKYAKPYIKDRIPMFIDKPITCREDEAIEFMREARANGVRLCGGSTCAALSETLSLASFVKNGECGELLGGNVAAPMDMNSIYGGFFFYSEHLVDIMTAIFGERVNSVNADRRENSVALNVRYDKFNVTATYLERSYNYTASVYGVAESRTEQLKFTPDSFRHEMDEMLHLLRGGAMKKSYESFVLPVFIMNAIVRSWESGGWEKLNEIKI